MVGAAVCRSWVPTSCKAPLCRVSNAVPRICASATFATDVERRISLARSTGRLDLSECGLVEVPAQVFQIEDLVELSLAGNSIAHLPDDIRNLPNLRRLGLAGNALPELPKGIGKLQELEGLWVHGNQLQSLPAEIGDLRQLRTLALAGNKLTDLPDTICQLVNLQIFSVAGNVLRAVPEDIGCLQNLRVLAMYGNELLEIPESLSQLSSLEDLWCQGNRLQCLPMDLSSLKSLRQLSLADNSLEYLPDSVGKLQALETLWVYGNQLQRIPRSFGDLHKLAHLWLEGNSLEPEAVQEALPSLGHLKTIGLSCRVATCENVPAQLISVSRTAGTGMAPTYGGYFKLYSEGVSRVVVVAFGSAPCVPNWGGLLQRVRKSMKKGHVSPSFDILYVVDSSRSWYTHDGLHRHPDTAISVGSARPGGYYRGELEVALQDYDRVVMLGDSMGASGALLFSDLATRVLAFCPQVDLATASIRPGKDHAWFHEYKDAILDTVLSSTAQMTVHCGSWSHDVEQAKMLPCSKVKLVEHGISDHRVAKALDSAGSLLSLVQSAIEAELLLV